MTDPFLLARYWTGSARSRVINGSSAHLWCLRKTSWERPPPPLTAVHSGKRNLEITAAPRRFPTWQPQAPRGYWVLNVARTNRDVVWGCRISKTRPEEKSTRELTSGFYTDGMLRWQRWVYSGSIKSSIKIHFTCFFLPFLREIPQNVKVLLRIDLYFFLTLGWIFQIFLPWPSMVFIIRKKWKRFLEWKVWVSFHICS